MGFPDMNLVRNREELFNIYIPFETNAIFQFDANGAYPAALLVRILLI